jgi:hypothetical protein
MLPTTVTMFVDLSTDGPIVEEQKG